MFGIFQQIGGPEVLIILVALILLFGAKRIPELARSLGKSMGEFKKGRSEGLLDDKSADADADDKSAESKSANSKT